MTPEEISECVKRVLDFFGSKTCYDFLPESSQAVIFDIDLPLKYAFEVAVENRVTFATLWDSQVQKACGMMTVTDYIKIVLHFGDIREDMNEYWDKPVRIWRDTRRRAAGRPVDALITVAPEDSLLTCLLLLYTNKIHRIPVVCDSSGLLYVMSLTPMLGYLVTNFPLDAPLFQRSIGDLGIGTYTDIHTAGPSTKMEDLLRLCMEKAISSVPIVDSEGILIDVFARYDVMNTSLDASQLSLSRKFDEISQSRPFAAVLTCTRHDSLKNVLEYMAHKGAKRLIVKDDVGKVVGVVSTGDIFKFFYKYHAPFTEDTESSPVSSTATN